MNKAVFLDRDGTINVEKNYLHRIEDFEFLPGVIEGLKTLQDAGNLLVIITNQSGIARGYYTEGDFHKLNEWILGELKNEDIEISGVYYCPHLSDARIEKYRRNCNCRKPAHGLFERAVKELDIDIDNSYAIGDRLRDSMDICRDTYCRGFLIGTTEDRKIIDDVKMGRYERVNYTDDLLSAANTIANSLIEAGEDC